MGFTEATAIMALVLASVVIPARVAAAIREIRSGRAANIDTRKVKISLLGMSFIAGGSLLLLDQPWLIAAAAAAPGTAVCGVIVELAEQAREREKTE